MYILLNGTKIYVKDEVDTQIETERNRAEAIELQLSDSILAEIRRAHKTEGQLQDSIDTEKERAETAEATLQGNIDKEKARATKEELLLKQDVLFEFDRASKEEKNLQDQIDAEKIRIDAIKIFLDSDPIVFSQDTVIMNGELIIGNSKAMTLDSTFGVATQLTSADNIDTIKIPGRYTWTDSVPKGLPRDENTQYGSLTVTKVGSGDDRRQLVTFGIDNTQYSRCNPGADNPWGEWKSGNSGGSVKSIYSTVGTYSVEKCLEYSTKSTGVSWGAGEIVGPKGPEWDTPGNIIELHIKCLDGSEYVSYQTTISTQYLQPTGTYWKVMRYENTSRVTNIKNSSGTGIETVGAPLSDTTGVAKGENSKDFSTSVNSVPIQVVEVEGIEFNEHGEAARLKVLSGGENILPGMMFECREQYNVHFRVENIVIENDVKILIPDVPVYGFNEYGLGTVVTVTEFRANDLGQGATGRNAVAFGSETTASGENSFAAGFKSVASGVNSTAIGKKAEASGENSTSIGWYTTAKYPSQVVVGRANACDENNVFEVGTGDGPYVTKTGFAVTKKGNIKANNLSVLKGAGAYSAEGLGGLATGEGAFAFGPAVKLTGRFKKITYDETSNTSKLIYEESLFGILKAGEHLIDEYDKSEHLVTDIIENHSTSPYTWEIIVEGKIHNRYDTGNFRAYANLLIKETMATAAQRGAIALGEGCETYSEYSVAVGRYNDNRQNAIFTVGNGTGNSGGERSTAFAVLKDGTLLGPKVGDQMRFSLSGTTLTIINV